MDLRIAPLSIARRPTPVTVIEGLRPGVRIHVKRDDLTGLLSSGNKVRKLEFLLADARGKGADLIITCGPVQSNHVRATLVACAGLGLKVKTVLRGAPEQIPDGNYLIHTLLGADIRFVNHQEYEQVDELMAEMAHELRAEGLRPYVIPEGGSNGVGALGYALAVEELAPYVAEHKNEAIFCAVGSGGTYAGLLAGKRLLGLQTPVSGIVVAHDSATFRKEVSRILREVEAVLGKKLEVGESDYCLDDRFIGPGYACLYPEAAETIRQVGRFGILLDPVYTAKAFYGMLRKVEELGYRNPLFIHTGGLFSLFPYRSELFARTPK